MRSLGLLLVLVTASAGTAQMVPPRVVADLTEICAKLGEEDPRIRLAVVHELGAHRDTFAPKNLAKSLAPLVDILVRDTAPLQRAAAATVALRGKVLAWQPDPTVLRRLLDPLGLRRPQDATADRLVALARRGLGSRNPETRRRAVHALGFAVARPEVVALLAARLREGPERERWRAAWALSIAPTGRVGRDAVQSLARATAARDQRLRTWSTLALLAHDAACSAVPAALDELLESGTDTERLFCLDLAWLALNRHRPARLAGLWRPARGRLLRLREAAVPRIRGWATAIAGKLGW